MKRLLLRVLWLAMSGFFLFVTGLFVLVIVDNRLHRPWYLQALQLALHCGGLATFLRGSCKVLWHGSPLNFSWRNIVEKVKSRRAAALEEVAQGTAG